MRKTGKKIIGIGSVVLLVLGIFLASRIARVLWYPATAQRQAAIEDLQKEYYSCFKLSLLPTQNFSEGDIEFFTGMPTKEVDYCFYNLRDVQDYLEEVYSTQEEVREIYLYLDPVEISDQYGHIARLYGKAYTEQLLSVISKQPDTFFGFVIPNYSAEYWSLLSDKQVQEAEKCIEDFLHLTELCENVKVYYMGFEEWLIGNPANYVDDRMHNREVHAFLIAQMLWREEYVLTSENVKERFALTEQIVQKKGSIKEIDLTEYDLVFFGDSVIGNYTDSLSIPGIVKGLTGAYIYNLGNGGSMATDDEKYPLHFGSMVERFLSGSIQDLEECTFKAGVEDYRADSHEGRKLCFVINYGLNDFFRSVPVDNPENPLDAGSYGGALRKGIGKLREAYPEAVFVLSGPNLITEYENGTRVSGELGGVLTEYVEIARSIAREYGAVYVDTYYEAGYTLENAGIYLADGYHPNHRGRYLLAEKLVEVCGEEFESGE